AELWNEIKHEDWSLVSDVVFSSYWPTRLWDFDKHYQYIGGQGAYGIGYGAPAAVGAALANRKHGRLTVNIQCDGDVNYALGVSRAGPLARPNDLGPAIRRAIEVVKRGEPALVDVLTQPR